MPASNVNWPTPLIRWPTLFPGQQGVPGTDSDRGLRQDSNGKILWVDRNHVDANDNRDGTNPDSPLATVGAALTKCRAYMGDVIVVAFNGMWMHANTGAGLRILPVNESVIVTVPGVRIVGLAPPSSLGVPWFPAGANETCITVRAIDVLIEGFSFWQTGLAGTTAIIAEWGTPVPPPVLGPYYGDNLTVRHCYFRALAYGIQLDFSYYTYVEDCRFESMTTAAIHNPSVYGEPDWCVIRNNMFTSNAADLNLPAVDSCLIENNRFMDVTAAIVLTGGSGNTIHANTIQGSPVGANNYVNLAGGANNIVSQNMLACTIAQYDTTCSDATSGSWVGNLCTNGTATAPPV